MTGDSRIYQVSVVERKVSSKNIVSKIPSDASCWVRILTTLTLLIQLDGKIYCNVDGVYCDVTKPIEVWRLYYLWAKGFVQKYVKGYTVPKYDPKGFMHVEEGKGYMDLGVALKMEIQSGHMNRLVHGKEEDLYRKLFGQGIDPAV